MPDPTQFMSPNLPALDLTWTGPNAKGFVNPLQTNWGGKWSRDWEDMGALEKVFSILSVGQYVSANVARALIDGNGDIAGAIWRGLTLKERGSFVDLLKDHGVKWSPLLGTVLDIALDPFTWLPGPVTLFKTLSKGTKVGNALETATKMFDNINPLKKVKALFDPKAGANAYVFDVGMMEKYGMRHEQVKVLTDWNNFAKTLTPELRDNLFRWRLNPPTRPEDYQKFSEVWSRFDELGQRAVQSKLLSQENFNKMFVEDGGVFLPQIIKGQLREWLPGRSLISPTKKPGFGFEETLFKVKDQKLFEPEMRKIADGLLDAGKKKSVDDMRTAAHNMVATLDDLNPFKKELTSFVDETIAKHKGDVSKIRKELFDWADYYTPVTDITELGKVMELNLVQAEYQKRFVDFVFDSPESQANGWTNVLKKGELVGDRRIVVRRSEVDTLARSLRQNKAKISAEVPLEKLHGGDVVEFGGLRYKVGSVAQDGSVVLTDLTSKKTLTTTRNFLSSIPAQPDGAASVKVYRESMKTPQEIRKLATQLQQVAHGGKRLILDYAELPRDVGKSLVETMESLGIQNQVLRGIDEDVAVAVDKMRHMFNPEDEDYRWLLRTYDKIIGHWARWATFMRWPFHIRNAVSNVHLAYLSGMNPQEMPKWFTLAGRIQTGTDELVTIGKQTMTGKQWLDVMDSHGVRGTGFMRSFVPQSKVDEAMSVYGTHKPKTLPGKALSKAYEVGETVGRTIEDNARIAVALSRLTKNGGDIIDATRHTWKYMFQYDQLTGFESKILKRLFPFYTWVRKNIPIQVESAINNPGRYVAPMKVLNGLSAINPETPDEAKFKPDYMQDFGYFKLPEMPKKWMEKISGQKFKSNVYVNIDLPWTAWAQLQAPINTLLSSLSPAISMFLANGANVKTFPELGERVVKYKGELKPAPWPIAFLPEGSWPALGIQPIRDKKTGRRIIGMPAEAVHNLFAVIPPLYELTKLFPDKRVHLEAEDAPWRRLKYLTGINFTPVNKNEERMYMAIERKKKMADAMKLMRQLGRPLTKQELEGLLND